MTAPDTDKPESPRWSHVFSIAMMLFGGAALAWMLRTTNWSDLGAVISGVGWWAGLILALDLIALGCDAAALHSFMRPEARMVSYLRVLGAQASGRAINVLTPFGGLGEITKVSLLVSHAPRSRVVSSIVLQNVANIYLSVLVMLIGIPITLLLVPLPHYLKIMVLAGIAVLVPLMVALGVIIHRGAVSTIVGALRHARIIKAERAKDWKARAKEIDKHISELHRHRSTGTYFGLMWLVISKLLGWTTTILLMGAMGIEIHPALVFGVLSVGVLIAWISSIVPLGLGLADGSNYALYGLLGASGEQGMFTTMLTRARSVAVAILGLGALAALQLANRIGQSRIRRKLASHKDQPASP